MNLVLRSVENKTTIHLQLRQSAEHFGWLSRPVDSRQCFGHKWLSISQAPRKVMVQVPPVVHLGLQDITAIFSKPLPEVTILYHRMLF